MIKVRIGDTERDMPVDESWINQQIAGRRRDGVPVCVRVTIKERDVDLMLSTPACGQGPGGGRLARPTEAKLIDLWKQRGLNDADFSVGNVVAFLKQLKTIL